jgi:hypothetical protein
MFPPEQISEYVIKKDAVEPFDDSFAGDAPHESTGARSLGEAESRTKTRYGNAPSPLKLTKARA